MKSRFIIKFIIFLLFLGGVGTFVVQSEVSPQSFISDIRTLNQENPLAASLSFIGVYILASLVFLPAAPLTAASGALFGPLWGAVLSIVGATVGATAAFGIARFLGEPFVRSLLKQKLQRVYEYNTKLAKQGFVTVLILRLVPVIPFNGLNFALGVTRVRLSDYVFGTAVGIVPGAFIFALGGESLAMLDIMSLVVVFILFALLSFGGYKIKQAGFMDTETTESVQDSYLSEETQSSKKVPSSADASYDIIVIGAGAAGLNIAVVMNEMGFRVLLAERDAKNIGGDCLNYGCVPSKALLHVAKAVHTARNEASKFGLDVNGEVNMETVKSYINGVKDTIREHENVEYFRNKGIDIVLGEASFTGENTVRINDKEYRGRRIVLATGSRPRIISIPGDEQVAVRTNEDIFDLETLPGHLVILGAGPIGIEIAQAFRYLGAEVTVVNLGHRILEGEAPDISDLMREQLEADGITFYLGYTAKEFTDARTVVLENQEGESVSLSFDEFLMAIGRDVSPSPQLNLEAANVTTSHGRIAVNDRLQTHNPRIFVAGDASGGLLFTHTTEQQSSLIVKNFFTPFKSSWKTDHMAWVTYTDPEIATFGLSEAELSRRKVSYQVIADDIPGEDRTITDNYPAGKVKLYLSKGKIMGGTIMAPYAGEIIQELILANTYKLSVEQVFNKVYPYPTASRVTRHALSSYFLAKLTPRARRMLHWLFRVFG